MSDVFFKLSAEEKDAVNAILKVVDAQKKSEDGFKRMKKGSDDVSDSLKKIEQAGAAAGKKLVDTVAPGIMQFATLGGAAVGAIEAISGAIEKSHARAEALSKKIQDVLQSLAQAGKISLLPEVEKRIAEVNSQLLSKDDKTGLVARQLMAFPAASRDQNIKALQFGAQARQGGLDPATAMGTFGQLQQAFPKAGDDDLRKAAGQLLGQKYEQLDESILTESKRFGASGKSLGEFTPFELAARASGESTKLIDRMRTEANTEINPEDIKGKKEATPEAKARLDALELEKENLNARKAQLENAELVLTEKGTSTGIKRGQTKQHAAIELERKQINAREADIGVEVAGLKHDEVLTFTSEQKRKAALAEIPQEQRFDAMLARPELRDPKTALKFDNFNAALQGFRARPPTDLISQNISEMEALAKSDRKVGATLVNQKEDVIENDRQGVKVDQIDNLEFQARSKKRFRESGGDVVAQTIGDLIEYAIGKPFKGALGTQSREEVLQEWDNKKKVQRVIVQDDEGKIRRVVPSREGGN